MAISMLKIRRPLGRLIFNMGIAIPGKTVFLIETAPWFLGTVFYHVFSVKLCLLSRVWNVELFIKFNIMMLTVYGICNMHRMICLLLSNAAVSLVWALYHKWETITVRNLIQPRILQYCRHLMKSCLQWSIQSNAITEGLCVMSIIEL